MGKLLRKIVPGAIRRRSRWSESTDAGNVFADTGGLLGGRSGGTSDVTASAMEEEVHEVKQKSVRFAEVEAPRLAIARVPEEGPEVEGVDARSEVSFASASDGALSEYVDEDASYEPLANDPAYQEALRHIMQEKRKLHGGEDIAAQVENVYGIGTLIDEEEEANRAIEAEKARIEAQEELLLQGMPCTWQDVDEYEIQSSGVALADVYSIHTADTGAKLQNETTAVPDTPDTQDPLGRGTLDPRTLKLVRIQGPGDVSLRPGSDFGNSFYGRQGILGQLRAQSVFGMMGTSFLVTGSHTSQKSHASKSHDGSASTTGVTAEVEGSGHSNAPRAPMGFARLGRRILTTAEHFEPTLFLAHVHAGSNARDLGVGRTYLKDMLSKNTKDLKVLVKENFERFVSCKSTIDDVHGRVRMLERNDRPGSTNSIGIAIKQLQAEASKAAQPLLVRQEEADRIQQVLGVVDRFSILLGMPQQMRTLVEQRDFDAIISNYAKCKALIRPGERSVWDNLLAEVEGVLAEAHGELESSLSDPEAPASDALDALVYCLQLSARALAAAQGKDPIALFLRTRRHQLQTKVSRLIEEHQRDIAKLAQERARRPTSQMPAVSLHMRMPSMAQGSEHMGRSLDGSMSMGLSSSPSAGRYGAPGNMRRMSTHASMSLSTSREGEHKYGADPLQENLSMRGISELTATPSQSMWNNSPADPSTRPCPLAPLTGLRTGSATSPAVEGRRFSRHDMGRGGAGARDLDGPSEAARELETAWLAVLEKLMRVLFEDVPRMWTVIGSPKLLQSAPEEAHGIIGPAKAEAETIINAAVEECRTEMLNAAREVLQLSTSSQSMMQVVRKFAVACMELNEARGMPDSTALAIRGMLSQVGQLCTLHLCGRLSALDPTNWESWELRLAGQNELVSHVPEQLRVEIVQIMELYRMLLQETDAVLGAPTDDSDGYMTQIDGTYERMREDNRGLMKKALFNGISSFSSSLADMAAELATGGPRSPRAPNPSGLADAQKLLVLLSNCNHVYTTLLPKLVAQFGSLLATTVAGRMELEENCKEVMERLSTSCQGILTHYLMHVCTSLSQFVDDFLFGDASDWAVFPARAGVRDAAFVLLHAIVVCHAQTTQFAAAFRQVVLEAVLEHVLEEFLTALQEDSRLANCSAGGNIQLYMEVYFLELTVQQLQTPQADELLDSIYELLLGKLLPLVQSRDPPTGVGEHVHKLLCTAADEVALDQQLQAIAQPSVMSDMERAAVSHLSLTQHIRHDGPGASSRHGDGMASNASMTDHGWGPSRVSHGNTNAGTSVTGSRRMSPSSVGGFGTGPGYGQEALVSMRHPSIGAARGAALSDDLGILSPIPMLPVPPLVMSPSLRHNNSIDKNFRNNHDQSATAAAVAEFSTLRRSCVDDGVSPTGHGYRPMPARAHA